MKKIPMTFLVALAVGFPRLALGEAGYTSADFLKIGMGARASAMADSFTAVSDDATAIYWNPAGLSLAQGTQVSLTHAQWLQGVNLDFVALSLNGGEQGSLGLGFTSMGLQSFLSTLEDPSGNYAGTGPSVSASDWSLSLGYSNNLSRFIPDAFFNRTLVGLAANLVNQNDGGPTGSALSFDAGLIQLFPEQHLSFGLDVMNMGTDIQDRLEPLDVKVGGAWYNSLNFAPGDRLTVAADLDLYSDTGLQPSLGGEYGLPLDRADKAFLRAGARTTDELYGFSFMTFGAGLAHDLPGFTAQLDYAFAPYGTIGPTNRFTLSLVMGTGEKHVSAGLSGNQRLNLDAPQLSASFGLKDDADEPISEWNLTLVNDKGEAVKEINGTGNPPSSVPWDIHTNAGALAAPGDYQALLRVKDVDGRVAESAPVTLKLVAPLSLDNLQWTLASDATFNIAQADLTDQGKDKLTAVGQGLVKYFGDINIEIQGHTDNKPCRFGPHCKFHNNQELSEARAQTVKDLFAGLGLKPENITVVGMADKVPVADNTTPQGRTQNRRIEIKLHSQRVETPQSVANAGIFLMENHQEAQALKLFQMVTDHEPDKPEGYRLLAECYQKMGNQAEADKAQDKAKELAPAGSKGL